MLGSGVLALWWGIIVFTSMIIGLGIYSGINPQTLKEIASSPKTPTLQGLKTHTYPALKDEACPVVRLGIQGLFNTVIREIDYEIARILGLEHLVEPIRALVLAMARRRLARAQEARREAILGEEREVELRGRRARRRAGGEGGSRVVRRLNEFLQGS